jgi:uncharacterized cupredoxin-like copper-binding protein
MARASQGFRPPTALLLAVAVLGAAAGACNSAAAAPLWTFAPVTSAATAPRATTDTAAPPVVAAVPTTAPTITLSEWHVAAASTMKAGTATFAIANAGTIQHELLVFKSDLAMSAYPKDKHGDIIEDGAGITLLSDGENIDVGGTQARTVNLVPGTYLFVCNIPGHFKAGMFQVVTVTP